MYDKVFGEVEFDYDWIGKIEIDWFGQKKEISLIISGEEDGGFDDVQYESYNEFIRSWPEIENELLKRVLDYYEELKDERGEDSDSYPVIDNTEDIKKMITIDALTVPLPDVFEGRSVALAFSCSWDEENGLGIRFINEKITEVGYQDVAF